MKELREAIQARYDEACDESKWPKVGKRTQRWGVNQGAKIRTLGEVLALIDSMTES